MSEEDHPTPEYQEQKADPRDGRRSGRRPGDVADSQSTWRVTPDAGETTEPWGQDRIPTTRMSRTSNGAPREPGGTGTVPPPLRPGYRPPRRQPPAETPSPQVRTVPPPADRRRRRGGGLLLKLGFASVAGLVSLFFVGVAVSVVGYVTTASTLPSPTELRTRQTAFVSSKIYDREGQLLYEVTDPEGGRRTYVPLEEISPHLIEATIATEDRDFWLHPGFDPVALARAFYYVLIEREIVSGASTIPQQLARMVLLPEERFEQSAERKIKEIVLAAELTRAYTKEDVLEIYLNELNYGNLAYGIQAAAETYFNVDAADLTLAQASFLAGLPQLPATYDPFGGGLELALQRHEDVLALMVEDGHISASQAGEAMAAMRAYEFRAPLLDIDTAPHFVVFVRRMVEERYGPEAMYRGAGLRITTTLDPDLQAQAERAVREGVAGLAERNATNGALVALDPGTGHVLAMVGSVDFHDEAIDGQVNVALRCRQPGSSIKPLTFLTSLEHGWTLGTLFWDVRTEFPDGANPPYVPVNYDRKYHGPVLMRDALANSYNVPAVEALQFVGVDGLLEMASRLGIESLVHPEEHCPEYPYEGPPSYGLALTLGGGEVKLLEMTGAFAALANDGVLMAPSPVLRVEDSRGNVLLDNTVPTGKQVVSPEHAYLITGILADDEARCAAFSCPSVLELSRPAAAKTGTTDDYRDAWTIGYTPDLAVGVWVGNSDNSPMADVPGVAGAGPIWHEFMEAAHSGLPVRDFERPSGIVEYEICALSGASPTEQCPKRKTELFAKGEPPLDDSHDWYHMVEIDAFTGLRANEFCPDHVVRQLMLDITDERGREWVQAHPEQFGELALAPLDSCTDATGHPDLVIAQPQAGAMVQGVVPVVGTVLLPNFEHYEAQYGIGGDPQGWGWISGPHLSQVKDGLLTNWDTTHLAPGLYTLRIRAFDYQQRAAEVRAQVYVAAPTATPLPPASPTAQPTPTPWPSATPTGTPLETPTEEIAPALTATTPPPSWETPTSEG